MIKFVLNPENSLPIVLPERIKYNGYTYTNLNEASDEFLNSIGLIPIPPRPSGVNAELIEWDTLTNNWVVNEEPSFVEYLCLQRCNSVIAGLSGVIVENQNFATSSPSSQSLIDSVLEINEEIKATISGLACGVYDCDNYPRPRTIAYNGIYLPI